MTTSRSGADPERTHLPPNAPPRNHGNTTAAWVTVTVVVLGGLLATLGVIASLPALAWTGGGVIVVGIVAGRVLKMAGFGQPTPPPPADA